MNRNKFIRKNKRICALVSCNLSMAPRLRKTAESLSNKGYDVSIIAWDRTGEEKKYIKTNNYKIINISIKQRSTNILFMFLYFVYFLIKALIYSIKLKFDIIHCYNFDVLPIGIINKKLRKKKLVYDAAELYGEMLKTINVPKIIPYIVYLFEFRLARFSDLNITVNHLIKKYLLYKGVNNVVDTMNCPIMTGWEANANSVKEIRKNLNIEDKFVVGFYGTLTYYRGLEELIKSAEIISKTNYDIQFLIIGRGLLKNKLQNIVKIKKLENIKFLDYVPYEIIPNYVSATDLQCILNSPKLEVCHIGNPNRFFESIYLGRPLLVSNFGTLKYLIDEIKCGMTVNPEDPNDIAEKIITLYKDPDARKKMGEFGVKAAKEIYNWESQSIKFLQEYEKL
ncbi:MAG: glycosyltransferase WbuB [Candidatus Lokiarchaeota archaeon]|nr:glycosyltransferase WbuB [Candidatus Lokiarchaeota archaeon]